MSDVLGIYIYLLVLVNIKESLQLADCGTPTYSLSTDQSCIELSSLMPPPATTEGSNYTFSCQTLLVRTMANIDYCPVGVCESDGTWTATSLSCGSSECLNGSSTTYTGKRTCTYSGRPCKRWDSQNNFTDPALFPENSTSAAENYCRDPGGTKGFPWCYTSDPAVPTESCGIQNCTDYNMTQGTCTNDYCGDPDMTVQSDDMCTNVQMLSFNRSAGSTFACKCASLLSGLTSVISYCPVRRCQPDSYWTEPFSISCAENECYTSGQSDLYSGGRSCTKSGWTCQSWDSQTPHNHSYSLPGVGARCRDPGKVEGQPWCYTTNPAVEFEVCDVLECSTLIVNSGTCTSTTSTSTTALPAFVTPSASLGTTISSITTTATIFPGVEVPGWTYRKRNTDTTGFGKQHSLSTSVSKVRCGQQCSQQAQCVFFTLETDNTCTLYKEDAGDSNTISCSTTHTCFQHESIPLR